MFTTVLALFHMTLRSLSVTIVYNKQVVLVTIAV